MESAEKDASHSAVSFVCGRISCVGVRVVVFTGTPCVETKTLKHMQWKQHNIMK